MIKSVTFDSGKLYWADCFDVLSRISDASVDMILCDLPYGTTASKWDVVLPMEEVWKEYLRIAKPNAAIVLFAREPFATMLRMSAFKLYRYDWIWRKSRPARYVQAKKMPLSYYENVCIFYKALPVYNPQFTAGQPYDRLHVNTTKPTVGGKENRNGTRSINTGQRYPSDVLEFSNSNAGSIHPTQKPLALFEYLIRTYTNASETVLDNTSGSGTTAIAAINTGRRWICIEKDEGYARASARRIKAHTPPTSFI